jgi:RHS repeat-associated protein
MREERFTYDKNLNIARRQTWINEVMESEAHQQQRHGRVTLREHKAWRHTTSRINPDTGKPEEGKFVRVVNAHNTTWKYDVNGRLVEKLVDKGGYRPLLWRYRWDARSQLTGIETPDGERWEYRYDPFGRRISKRCTSHNKPGMDFHWNGDQLTDEIPVGSDDKPDDENAIRWVYEPGSFTPLARYNKGQLHYAITDTVGRIQELLTEDGTIVWRGKQQLWGREESANDANVSCRLRFPGQYEDEESGLYYNRFRYYDCETGQYISADPIGSKGGINLYAYVINPLQWLDPLGLKRKKRSKNSGGTFTDSNGTVRNSDGTFASGESTSASNGRQAHKNYELTQGGGYDFNRSIPGSEGKFRPDAINFEDNIVRELKPDTPSGRCKGKRQLQGYLEYLNEHFPCDGGWTGFLDIYRS